MWNMREDFDRVASSLRGAQERLTDASRSGVPMGVQIVEAAELQRRIVKAQRAIEDSFQFLRTLSERVERAERVMEFEKGVDAERELEAKMVADNLPYIGDGRDEEFANFMRSGKK